MVVVEFLYDEIKKLADFPRDKVIEGLTEIGAPCEYEKETGKIMVELTPNRPDWYSMEGLARTLKAYYKKEIAEYGTKKSDYIVNVDKSVGKIRPYTVCAVVKGLKFNDERIRDMVLLQEKLIATLGRRVKRFGLGVYPLDAIAFPVTYTTMKPEEIRYHPLNYPHEADAREILVNHPKGKEYGHLLKDFQVYPVFIDADNKILSLIPIVNSQETGKVDNTTRNVFIEVTGNDRNSISAALNILACTFADMGGEIYSVKVKYADKAINTPDLKPRKMKLDLETANKVLGIKLTKKQVVEYLKKMGYGMSRTNVMIPPYRADIIGYIDIIEDIAIAHGYNKFEPTLPGFFSAGKADKTHDAVDGIMRGMGFVETNSFILTNEKKIRRIGYKQKIRKILNPSGEEFTAIRPTLVADMLDTIVTNKTRGLPQKFYEIGYVYENNRTYRRLCFGVVDNKLEFSAVRGYAQTLFKELGMEFRLEKIDTDLFEKDMGAGVRINGRDAGIFGKINANLLKAFGLDFEVYVGEFQIY